MVLESGAFAKQDLDIVCPNLEQILSTVCFNLERMNKDLRRGFTGYMISREAHKAMRIVRGKTLDKPDNFGPPDK